VKLALRLLAVAMVVAIGAAAWFAVARVRATPPPVAVSLAVTSTWVPAPGQPPAVSSPASGSLVVDAIANGTVATLVATDATRVRPIASVAKAMTALVILEAHPLSGADAGPVITITQVDVDDYRHIAAQDGSVVPVTSGERFSERDLLLGLMLPSANNLALTAARWVDGNVPAFVAHLNTRAAALGMTRTHFADPDGLDVNTTSTAGDLVLLAQAVVANQQLVSVVSTVTATMPDGLVVTNLDQLLGSEPGWLGIKTGWTPQAAGCLLFAARRPAPPGLPSVTVVGAILGQPPDAAVAAAHPELGGAFHLAQAAVDTAFAGYTWVTIGPSSLPVKGIVTTAWGETTAVVVGGEGDRSILVRLGDALTVTASATSLAVPSSGHAGVGSLSVSRGGQPVGSWQLMSDSPIDGPSVWWRLQHG
jgi:D-alanyl-D-alanine carboxypeptidase (penicillin-binding protein 5/6)